MFYSFFSRSSQIFSSRYFSFWKLPQSVLSIVAPLAALCPLAPGCKTPLHDTITDRVGLFLPYSSGNINRASCSTISILFSICSITLNSFERQLLSLHFPSTWVSSFESICFQNEQIIMILQGIVLEQLVGTNTPFSFNSMQLLCWLLTVAEW